MQDIQGSNKIKSQKNVRFFYFTCNGEDVILNLLFDIQPTTFYDEISERNLENNNWDENELLSFCYQISKGLEVSSRLRSSILYMSFIFSVFAWSWDNPQRYQASEPAPLSWDWSGANLWSRQRVSSQLRSPSHCLHLQQVQLNISSCIW